MRAPRIENLPRKAEEENVPVWQMIWDPDIFQHHERYEQAKQNERKYGRYNNVPFTCTQFTIGLNVTN